MASEDSHCLAPDSVGQSCRWVFLQLSHVPAAAGSPAKGWTVQAGLTHIPGSWQAVDSALGSPPGGLSCRIHPLVAEGSPAASEGSRPAQMLSQPQRVLRGTEPVMWSHLHSSRGKTDSTFRWQLLPNIRADFFFQSITSFF